MILAAEIESRIHEILSSDDPTLQWLKPAVERHHFLPLYLGWISALGIRPDGSFVRWDHEEDRAMVKPIADPFWQRLALCQGSKSYPELRPLIPDRPPHATDCATCGGTGEIAALPTLVCECGGAGWRISGEPFEPSPG